MINNTVLTQKSIIVEGNIGAGKSTFLKIIEEYLNVQVVFEPLAKWQQVGGAENLLEKFYADTTRWAYTFQSYAFITRIMEQQEHARVNEYPFQVLERSVYSDRYCFAKNCFELGTMSALEWELYQQWFSWLVDNYSTKPSGFIYLRTDPQICHERLQKRNRYEEAVVPLEYIKQLHDKHEQWLINKVDILPYLVEVPVLTLSCDKDFENDIDEQEQHMEKIVQFLQSESLTNNQTHKISSLSL